MFSNSFPEKRAVYEIMWKKYDKAREATDNQIIWHKRIAGWISKVTDTHSEHVKLIAFPRQQ